MKQSNQINPDYLYNENDIYEVLDAHVRSNNLQYAFLLDGRIATTNSLFRGSDGQLKDLFQHDAVLIIDPTTNAPYRNAKNQTVIICSPRGYNAGPIDDAPNTNLIAAWNAEHRGHRVLNNIQTYPYHINANHWGFGMNDDNDELNRVPYYDPILLGHQAQRDGTSCGVISAEYGKNIISGNNVGYNINKPVEIGAKGLRRQHINEVNLSIGRQRPNLLDQRQQANSSNKKPKGSSKPKEKEQQEPEPEIILPNPFRGKGDIEITAPDLSGDLASKYSSLPETEKKLQGKSPRVKYSGEPVNPEQDLDEVRWLVKNLYNNKGIGAEINKAIEKYSSDTDNQEVIAGLHALNQDLKKIYLAKYRGNNLLRELKEAETAESDPKSFGAGLNTLIKNRRMGVPESIGVGIAGGSKEDQKILTDNTIYRVITKPIPPEEKRLIENMLEASNREMAYYEGSIKNLIEHGLVFDEKTFEVSKSKTLAKELLHKTGDALNWLGRGIFAPPTKPQETRTWQKHVEYRNKLLENYYRNLNPDRDGAFRIKYRELLSQSFSDSFYSELMDEEEFKKMLNIVKDYAQEQETEKFRNLDQLEKNLTGVNEKILAKAEEIGLKEDELWKYKMLQMVVAFSPLAPLNILNHIGDIVAPIKDFLDIFGIDTVIDWLLHDSPLKFVTETFDFAKDAVSPILDSASNLSDSPIAGIIIDGAAGLVLTDKWTELSNLRKAAYEESKKLNKGHLKNANEAVTKYENSKITEYAKRVVSELDKIIETKCGGDKEKIKDAYFSKAEKQGIPHNNLVRELKNKGFKEDDIGIYNLVKTHCDRTGINFESLYGPKAKKGQVDLAVSDSKANKSSKKELSPDDFSEEEKNKIREKAKELQEMYRKQEDKDIEQIKSWVIKYIENSFDRSGTSRPAPDKNLLKLTDNTIPKPYDIESRPGHENFNKTTKPLNNQKIFIGQNFSG